MSRLHVALIAAALAILCGGARRAPAQDDAAGKPAAPAGKPEPGSAEEVKALEPEARAKRLAAAMRDLAAGLATVQTLRAKFTQTKHLDVFDEDVVSKGTMAMALAAPARLRWEYETPVRSVLVVNGDKARRERTSRKGAKTVKSFPLAEDPVAAATAEQVFLWTRGDFEKGGRSYAFELVSEKPLAIRATPTDERLAKVVAAVDLRFSDDRKSLLEVALSEKTKARTVIAFSEIERNPELAADLFRVEE